jgi:YHS domain-containing protein
MTNAPSTDTSDTSLTRDILYAARYYLGGRRTLFVLAAVLIVGGLALNWGWLVAAGLAPILLALLPCAVMCGLGLCMHKMAGGAHGGSKSETAGSMQARAANTANSYDRGAHTADLVDPVSQRMLPAATAIASVHRDRVYYFEDRANRDAFEAEPEKYLTALPVIVRETDSPGETSKHPQQRHGCC